LLIDDAKCCRKIIKLVSPKKMKRTRSHKRGYSYNGRTVMNFARFKMPDGNTTVILQGKSVLRLML
jgi:hypothetical protein